METVLPPGTLTLRHWGFVFPSQWQKENRTETETAEIEISRVQNHKNKDRNEERDHVLPLREGNAFR